MLPTRFEINTETEYGAMRSWETIKSYSAALDQEIDYAFKSGKVLVSVEFKEAKSSWVA